MPWKVSELMSEKVKFIGRFLDGERMTDLCKEFGISRKTGYKIVRRFQNEGSDGLKERSRKPKYNPNRTPGAMIKLIVKMRKNHSTWGPKKIRQRILDQHPGIRVPVPSTIGLILKDYGLTSKRQRKRRAQPTPLPLKPSKGPNDIWSIDFKGQFRLKNKKYCYPLTVSDHFSRYLLCCEALDSTRSTGVFDTMQAIFQTFGVPDAMRSDNGSPFASTGLLGLTQFGVWLLRLGIRLERIQPGHPEQNGRHERIHLTLKQDTTRPPGNNFLQQQEMFDHFMRCYNYQRPHEALQMKTPSTFYSHSSKQYEPHLPPLDYPLHDKTLRVHGEGTVTISDYRLRIYISQALAEQNIGIRQLEEHSWIVNFMNYELGYIDTKSRLFLPTTAKENLIKSPTNVLPMSSV